MTSVTNDEKTILREALSGPGLLVLSFAIIVGVASALGNSLAGGGIWLVLVAAARDVWVPNLVSLVYRRRWSRALLWPFSVADESECIGIFEILLMGIRAHRSLLGGCFVPMTNAGKANRSNDS
jgi:hypothetical protein